MSFETGYARLWPAVTGYILELKFDQNLKAEKEIYNKDLYFQSFLSIRFFKNALQYNSINFLITN